MVEMRAHQNQQTAIARQIQQHLGLLILFGEDTTTVEVQIPPPQEATIDAIASVDPQDEPQTVDTITATPADESFPLEALTTLSKGISLSYYSVSFRRYHFFPLFSIALDILRTMLILVGGRVEEGSIGIEFQSQKSGEKYEELVVERSLKLDALNLDWLGVIDGSPLHGHFRKQYL
ncbi:hypothetical protein AAG906_008154 [Vitis piasezkii]